MTLPSREQADRALLSRSLLRVDDALRLVEHLEELLGDRVLRDPFGEPDPLLFVRDRAHPEWVAPDPLLAVDMDIREPDPPRFVDPEAEAWWLSTLETRRQSEPQPMPSRVKRSGRFTFRCGAALWQLTYGKDGMRRENMRSCGPSGPQDEPYELAWGEEGVFRGQAPPLPLFVRPDLSPDGHPPEQLAQWLAELDPTDNPTRVRMPVPAPGGIMGVHWRAQRGLRLLLWGGLAERLPDASGGLWFVVDGLVGETFCSGPSFEEATRAFAELLETVTVLLPPPEPVTPLPEPVHEEKEWTDEKGTKHLEMRSTLVIIPKNLIPWPPTGKENVPAAAFRLQWEPVIPEAWRALGFTRVLPLVGEYGSTGCAWVREEPDGATVLGRALAERLDPERLEQDIAAAMARAAADRAEFPLPDWERDPTWIWHYWSFEMLRDKSGERFAQVGSGIGEGIDPGSFEPPLERQLLRWEKRP